MTDATATETLAGIAAETTSIDRLPNFAEYDAASWAAFETLARAVEAEGAR